MSLLIDPIRGDKFANFCGEHWSNRKPGPRSPAYCVTHYLHHHFNCVPDGVLVTHNADWSATEEMLSRLPAGVVKWFSMNCATHHPRCQGLPIGLRNADGLENLIRDESEIDRAIENEVYLCATIGRLEEWHRQERIDLYSGFSGKPWVTAEGGGAIDEIPQDVFYRQIHSHRFVLSPPGAGKDCHRTWEALYLRRIPIVRWCPELSWFDRLPILFVEDWDEVCPDLLESAYNDLSPRFNDPGIMAMLTFEYWKDSICSCLPPALPEAETCG